LIYNDEKAWAATPDDQRAATIEYFDVPDELRDHGSYVAGAPLEPTTTASTVRTRDDEQLVTDGPFAETK
jgi:hypothetical protein